MEKHSSSGQITNHAMTYGTHMGIYWIAKFMLIPFIFSVPFTSLLFMGLTIGVPFLGYHFVQQYRRRQCPDGQLSFTGAWTFCMLMYFFASLLTSIAHYIFFRYIDQGELLSTYTTILDDLANANATLATSLNANKQALDQIRSMTPIELTIQLLLNNLFYGMLMALPTALMTTISGRKEQRQSNTPQ